MKKVTYSLVALLLICIVAIGVLWAGRVSDRRQIAEMETQLQEGAVELDNATVQLTALKKEKTVWDQEKARVGQSLGSVRGVLIKTLGDLEEVSAAIGMPIATETPAASPTPAQPTEPPAASPTAVTEATKTPAATATPKLSPTATSKATATPTASPAAAQTAATTATSTPKAEATATPSK